ncbi:unnamed protein product, partial [Prorocentrum cordatum]
APATGGASGGRPMRARLRREALLPGRAEAECAQAACTCAADLATYWSNSVRSYALRGSPFLRPPVAACVWCLELEADVDAGGAEPQPTEQASARDGALEASAVLLGVHDRRCLEIAVSCRWHGGALSGTAWCVAVKGAPSFEGAVVPPVPLSPSEMDAGSDRWRALQRRRSRGPARLVRPAAADVCSDALPGPTNL